MNALIIGAIVSIPFFARNVRGATLAIAQSDYIAAARLSGRNTFSLLLFELMPNLISVIIVFFNHGGLDDPRNNRFVISWAWLSTTSI